MERFLPALGWLRRYDRDTLQSDALAAVIVTIMLIPQSLAYALLAGLPPAPPPLSPGTPGQLMPASGALCVFAPVGSSSSHRDGAPRRRQCFPGPRASPTMSSSLRPYPTVARAPRACVPNRWAHALGEATARAAAHGQGRAGATTAHAQHGSRQLDVGAARPLAGSSSTD